MTGGSARLVDARGLLCPWPVLRLSRAARENGAGEYRILADDPVAPGELASLCAERGWGFARVAGEEAAFDISIG